MLGIIGLTLAFASDPEPNLKAWGLETLQVVRRELYMAEKRLYMEQVAPDSPPQPAFNWPAGVMLTALCSAARLDAAYRPWLQEYADALQSYWNDDGPVAGYDVLPMPKPKDRYYDDNAWMVLALIECHEIVGDAVYLDRAERAMRYVLSGEDEKLGGGIYWRESDKRSKNTCSNAPSAVAALKLYQHTKKKEYLQTSERLYAWVVKTLEDPQDLLLWDNISLEGRIEKTKWSYNTGLVIRYETERALMSSGADRRRWTSKARARGASALRHWFAENGWIRDDAAFAHLLHEALLLLDIVDPNAGRKETLLQGLAKLRTTRDDKGRYSKRWGDFTKGALLNVRLIDQASAARAFLQTAHFSRK